MMTRPLALLLLAAFLGIVSGAPKPLPGSGRAGVGSRVTSKPEPQQPVQNPQPPPPQPIDNTPGKTQKWDEEIQNAIIRAKHRAASGDPHVNDPAERYSWHL
jgi:hypothetical protein